MAGSKTETLWRRAVLKADADLNDANALIARLNERIAHLEECIDNWDKAYTALETKLKFNSAVYSEGGSGEYVNNEEAMNRFEEKP